jgi:hypothetical protein
VSRTCAAALACALAAVLAPVATAVASDAPAAPAPARVTLDRTGVVTRIGGSFHVGTTVENTARAPVSGLVAHLDVVSLDPDVTVDPEDWSPERTRYLPPLAAGRRARIGWEVKAVDGGRFTAYVVVLVGRRTTVGPGLDVRVARHRTLDPAGVVPLAVGLPGVLGLALLSLRLRRRRRG